jgi:hypothetical protein
MSADNPPKGIPKKPMRKQLRGEHRKNKPVKVNKVLTNQLKRKDNYEQYN